MPNVHILIKDLTIILNPWYKKASDRVHQDGLGSNGSNPIPTQYLWFEDFTTPLSINSLWVGLFRVGLVGRVFVQPYP